MSTRDPGRSLKNRGVAFRELIEDEAEKMKMDGSIGHGGLWWKPSPTPHQPGTIVSCVDLEPPDRGFFPVSLSVTMSRSFCWRPAGGS